MLMTLILASMLPSQIIMEGPISVLVERQAPVIYELPTVTSMTSTTYEYSYSPVVQSFQTVRYSLPATTFSFSGATYFGASPFVRTYSPFLGGRTVIKERGPGFFRSKTILRY